MRLLGTRRAALVAGVATVATVALAGCSAGQVAETALKKPSNMGVNADTADGTVAIRNLLVAYPGPAGYPAGANAPLEVSLANQTATGIVVDVSSRPAEDATPEEGVVAGAMVALVSSGSAATPDNVEPSSGAPVEPSASAPPPSAARPARITIPAHDDQSFRPGDPEQLEVLGLSGRALPGMSVNLVFEFSNGAAPLVLKAPIGVPLSPAPRESGDVAENHEPE